MESYFENVIRQMTVEEVKVLGHLYEEDANASFKAIARKKVQEVLGLSQVEFRKTIEKLTATQFVDVVQGKREHRIFLTVYGQEALETSLHEEETE